MSKIILNGIEYSNGITYQELQPVIYSDEEREIGVWRDNKPLYQKTAYISNVSILANSSTNVNISDYFSDVDSAVDYECCDENGNSIFPNIMVTNGLSPYSIGVTVDKSSDHIVFTRGNGSNATISVHFTLRYTKTTDVAGSGNWNTDGVPTHHYSTNEQVIGTWIDGKPRYEITLSGSGSYSAGTELVVPLPTNADKVVIMGGYVDIGTDWLPVNLTLGVGTGTTNGVYCYPNKSTGIHIYSSIWTFSEYNVTVQYCKTTD